MNWNYKDIILIIVLLLVLILTGVLAAKWGSAPISWSQFWQLDLT